MTIEIDNAATAYGRHIFDVVNGVQEAKEIRENAFAEAERWARELTRLLKGGETVSKRYLALIYQAMEILENEAPNSRHERRVMEIVDAIHLTFGLILSNKSHDDWNPQPGVPQVR
ncbi:hypothetical protein HHL11_29245 [Ramlibacter sp. G-1-2-2]|uniref:Uncharacterized protein n=1 Tax=Ramlibacter agri TaxID=2728837 RepID=A0A848HEV0_9BURK|nr:hypothetical protein [Ramlibacter agri]NML47871.1 hypothetical protein [Ramlibacter agri]